MLPLATARAPPLLSLQTGSGTKGEGQPDVGFPRLAASKGPPPAAWCLKMGSAARARSLALSLRYPQVPEPGPSTPPDPIAHSPLWYRRKARYGRQLSVMFWRTLTDIVRNPALLLLHCLVALVMGLITGLTFYDSDMTNIGESDFRSFFSGFPVLAARPCATWRASQTLLPDSHAAAAAATVRASASAAMAALLHPLRLLCRPARYCCPPEAPAS